MIPKIIHYCWFGRGPMPDDVLENIASWHKYMPDWEYILWNEDNFDVSALPYTREAYDAGKFAFVSDCARLYALYHCGGIYFDTDVEVFKPFDSLLNNHAFSGFEGNKRHTIGMGILGSEAGMPWFKKQLDAYADRHFILPNGKQDLTPNPSFIAAAMTNEGFIHDGKEKEWDGLHIYPPEYFYPRHTTGEYIRTELTLCDHKYAGSWIGKKAGAPWYVRLLGQKNVTRLIKLKRKIAG